MSTQAPSMEAQSVTDLVSHFESHLGPIVSGWSRDELGHELSFTVALYERGPVSGTRTLGTLGLSKTPLPMRSPGSHVRLEVVMLYRDADGHGTLPSVLQDVCKQVLRDQRALLRGHVLGPRGPLTAGSTLEALYVAVPVYFPDTFATFVGSDLEPIVVAWLVPISSAEAQFVRHEGWETFEQLLVAVDPDLLDLSRASIV